MRIYTITAENKKSGERENFMITATNYADAQKVGRRACRREALRFISARVKNRITPSRKAAAAARLEAMQTIANRAINRLQHGILYKRKDFIISAYNLVENAAFSWDGLDTHFKAWEQLLNAGNEILYS